MVRHLGAEHLAMLNPGHEQAQLMEKRTGHLPKKKGGNRPIDLTALETYLDLKDELDKKNFNIERVWTLTLYLRRLVNH